MTLDASIRSSAVKPWKQFLAVVEPFRPDLYRYCRRLTSTVWEAEDLIQDTLEQAYARLASIGHDVEDPRAYVLRIASNLWVNQVRREVAHRRIVEQLQEPDESGSSVESIADQDEHVSEAASVILEHLAPQERAAILLKSVFDFSLKEIAAVLGTTTGAVKSALHRGRSRMASVDENTIPRYPVSKAVIDLFVERFNARDRDGLLELMLESVEVHMGSVVYELSKSEIERNGGWLEHNLADHDSAWETTTFHGEPIVLVTSFARELAITSVMRFETNEGVISRIKVYAFCPDAVREIASKLGREAAPFGAYHITPGVLERMSQGSPN